jgi:hypothetical protein
MSVTIHKQGGIVPGESLPGRVSFADRLDSGDTLSSPTVTATQVAGTTDADGIALSGAAVNTGVVTINSESVAIGKGVVFVVTAASDAVPGAAWEITVSASGSDSRTRKEITKVVIL